MKEADEYTETNKKRAVLVGAVLAVLFVGSCIWIWRAGLPTAGEARVCIYQDGALLEEHPLSEDGVYRIELEDGAVNVVEIKDGGVCVSEANCENQVCVQTGVIRSSAYPIVCLPHKLVVQIEGGDQELDGAVR